MVNHTKLSNRKAQDNNSNGKLGKGEEHTMHNITEAFKDKTLVITGGTGSFVSTVLKHFLTTDIGEIRIISRDEKKQDWMRHTLQAQYPDYCYKVQFYVGDVRYWYELSLNKERVSHESLYFYDYPSPQPTRIFWREYAEGQSIVKFNPAAVKLKVAEIDAINLNCWKNMSFFASMTKVNISIERVNDVIRWINEKLMPGINRSTELSGYAKEKMLKDEGFRDYLTSFIKTADLRIAEVSVKETAHALNEQQLKMVSEATSIDEDLKAEILSSGSIKDIDTGFKVRVKNARGEEEYILPESRQSDGTTRVIEIESAIYTTIKEQAFLHVDEIEASLHPSLLDFVLNEFLKENDNRSQLLVTTHYDPLLDGLDVNDLFGKDSVWFTEKKEDGNTELYPLTDFKGLGKLSSIRKSYKNGQFGAVPEIYV